jgi:hypothetical protein
MKNLKAGGYGLAALCTVPLLWTFVEFIFAPFRTGEPKPGLFFESAPVSSSFFLASFIACICFQLAHGRASLLQKLLLSPGLYLCAAVLPFGIAFNMAPSWASFTVAFMSYSVLVILIPSLAGALVGSPILPPRPNGSHAASEPSAIEKSLAAMAAGIVCLVVFSGITITLSLAWLIVYSTAKTSSPNYDAIWDGIPLTPLILVLLVLHVSFFFAGMAAHRLFSRHFSFASRKEQFLLSPSPYLWAYILYKMKLNLPSHQTPGVLLLAAVYCLVVFLVSFAGVRFAMRRDTARGALGVKTELEPQETPG